MEEVRSPRPLSALFLGSNVNLQSSNVAKNAQCVRNVRKRTATAYLPRALHFGMSILVYIRLRIDNYRHQQNPSMNAGGEGEGNLKSFYGYKETFGKDAMWVDVPRELKFVHTTNPYEDAEDGPGGSGVYNEGDTSFMTDDNERYGDIRHGNEYRLPQAAYPAYATQGLEALSAVASQGQYSYAAVPPSIDQHAQTSPQQPSITAQHSQATARNLDYILNPASAGSASPAVTNLDPHLHTDTPSTHPSISSPETLHTKLEHVRSYSSHSYTSSHGRSSLRTKGLTFGHDRRAAIEDPELAFLLRDFSERMGLWMDIFDLNFFFSTTVPLLALKCPLLLYSCVALSAKGLARVDGRKPKMGGQISSARQSQMEKWPGPPLNAEARLHRARQYYDVAVSLLRQALSGASRPRRTSLSDIASPNTISNVQGYPLPGTDSDELIAATAILCVYEFFDVSRPEWSRHLDGAKSLFDIANERMADLTRPPSPSAAAVTPLAPPLPTFDVPRSALAKGLRAVFWCWVRQDMLSAFINHTVTRVDTDDLALWRSAGLKLTFDGSVCPSNPLHPDHIPEQTMSDDMVGNALVWLLAKMVNLIVAPHVKAERMPPISPGAQQRESLDPWNSMDAELEGWYEGLPASFNATAVRLPISHAGVPEKWFPRPSCASTMQWWHFARIQLLHHKPNFVSVRPESSSPAVNQAATGMSLAERHANYASILRQSREHAKEIVAIGLGRSDEGTRVHSVQPLWTAGMVLGTSDEENVSQETDMWRRNIISQLRGIERDMGWAAEYRVQSLLEMWHLPSTWGLDMNDE